MKIRPFEEFPELPDEVHPDQLPGIVEDYAQHPRMKRYPGMETHAAEAMMRESYGVPRTQPVSDWKKASWPDRARDLVRDAWAKVREIFQEKQPEPEPMEAMESDEIDWDALRQANERRGEELWEKKRAGGPHVLTADEIRQNLAQRQTTASQPPRDPDPPTIDRGKPR